MRYPTRVVQGVKLIKIVHGIPESMRASAVELYDDAFGSKFAVAIPSRTQRVALLTASLNLKYGLGAFSEGRLVGLAGYQTEQGSFTDRMTYPMLIEHAGRLRGNWAAVVFSLYERSTVPAQLLMDGIVVDPALRGQGVGTQLLDEIVRLASSCHYETVRLDVVDTNPNARRLYERVGFVPTNTESFGWLRWLLGFGASTTLVRGTNNVG